jgi:hypothetical protein
MIKRKLPPNRNAVQGARLTPGSPGFLTGPEKINMC